MVSSRGQEEELRLLWCKVVQWEYLAQLAARCGVGGVEAWREKMFAITSATKHSHPQTYRDEFPDPELVREAQLAQLHLPSPTEGGRI